MMLAMESLPMPESSGTSELSPHPPSVRHWGMAVPRGVGPCTSGCLQLQQSREGSEGGGLLPASQQLGHIAVGGWTALPSAHHRPWIRAEITR